MPNDDVFAPTTAGAPAPTPSPTAPASVGAAPAQAPSSPTPGNFLTKDEFSAAMRTFAADLKGAIESTKPSPAQTTPDEWQSQFFQDPKGQIETTINEATAPAIAVFARAQANDMLDKAKDNFDAKWGTGAWDKYIEADIRPAVDNALKANPLQVVERTAVTNAINGLTGIKVDQLLEHQTAAKGAQTTATAAQEAAIVERLRKELPGLSGGVRLTTGGATPTLNDEGKEFIANYFKHTGTKPDEAALVRNMSINSYAEWKAAQPKEASK